MASSVLELVRGRYRSFAEGDAAAVLGAFHPEIEWKEKESTMPEHDPHTRRAARLGSFRLIRAYPEGSHGVIVGRVERMVTSGAVGSVSTTLQRPILAR